MVSVNTELAFIASILHHGNFQAADKLRITEDYLSNPQAREIFRFIRDTYHGNGTLGQVPSTALVNARFPGVYLPPVHDTVEILAEDIREQKIKFELLRLAENIQSSANSSPKAALAELTTEYQRLSGFSEIGEDLSMAGAYEQLLQDYELVQNSKGLTGIPYPWDILNEETQGIQNGQFIVLYGRPKSMKSWIAIHIGAHAYMAGRRRVLFYTREMPTKMISKRVACRLAKVDYGAFSKAKLQPAERDRVFTLLKELGEDEKMAGANDIHQPYFIITTDRSRTMSGSGGGVAWLQAKIKELKPDLVIVDGMYLLRDDRTKQRTVDWKQIAHISQDLRGTALDMNIPIIGVTQANRSADKSTGEDLTEMAFSDALGMDADIVFRVSKRLNVETRLHELLIKAPGMREGVFDGIVVNGQPATSFDFIRTIVDQDSEGEYESKGKNPMAPSFRQKEFKDPKIPLKMLK